MSLNQDETPENKEADIVPIIKKRTISPFIIFLVAFFMLAFIIAFYLASPSNFCFFNVKCSESSQVESIGNYKIGESFKIVNDITMEISSVVLDNGTTTIFITFINSSKESIEISPAQFQLAYRAFSGQQYSILIKAIPTSTSMITVLSGETIEQELSFSIPYGTISISADVYKDSNCLVQIANVIFA